MSLKTTLRPHQPLAIQAALSRDGTLIDGKMGSGKSLIGLGIITESKAVATLILCPVSVRGVWRREVWKHTEGIEVVLPDKGDVRRRAREIKEHVERARITRQPFVVVVNYESAWRTDMAKVLLGVNWHLVLFDECFPAGTMIDTPSGPKAIETLAVGDKVLGRCDDDGSIKETEVRHCFKNDYAGHFVSVAGVSMTPSHPVWTAERGYVNAASVGSFETVAINGSNGKILRRLRKRVSAAWWQANVLPQMRSGVEGHQTPLLVPANFLQELWEDVSPEARRSGVLLQELQESDHYELAREQRKIEAGDAFGYFALGCAREDSDTSSGEREPFSQQGSTGEVDSSQQSKWLRWIDDLQGREWQRTNCPAGIVGWDIGLADGSCSAYWTSEGQCLSQSLQAGYSERRSENRCRDRWCRPQFTESPSARREERWFSAKPRLANRATEKRRSHEQPTAMCGESFPVYNIETGLGNYFAEGLLVHNCHRIKSPSGKASRFARKLKARRRVGLTGTPCPHSPLDIWAQARAIAPGAFEQTYTAFRSRYAVITTAPGFPKIIGWQNLDEYQLLLTRFIHDCGDVDLHLPPLTEQVVDVELEPSAAKAYAALERDFYAEIERGEVTVGNALTKILRLQQITGGTIKLDDGTEAHVSEAKQKALTDILDDLQGQNVAVFCRFKSDLLAVRQAAEAARLSYGEISGSTKDGLDDHAMMRSDLDIVGVQIQSGGVGIDLTRASVGIYYSLTHSLGDHEQSRARLHRPGQHRHTHLLYLVAPGTIDTRIMQALQDKKDVIEAIVYGRGR